MGYTPLDQNHGAVAEYNGDISKIKREHLHSNLANPM